MIKSKVTAGTNSKNYTQNQNLLPKWFGLYQGRLTALACPISCWIPLQNKYIVLVDPEDWITLHKFNWQIRRSSKNIYAVRKIKIGNKWKSIYMHREISNCPDDQETHHKNRNTLDNRKANLMNLEPLQHRFISRAAKFSCR